MENYLKYKLVGGKLILKKGVTPHKFACQKTEEKNLVERHVFKKQQQIEYFERVPDPDICHENLISQEEFGTCKATDSNNTTDIDPTKDSLPNTLDCLNRDSVAVQVSTTKTKAKYRRKATNTDADFSRVPKLKTNKLKKKQFRKPLMDESIASHKRSSVCDSLDPFFIKDTPSDFEVQTNNESESIKKLKQEGTLKAREPKLFLGLPPPANSCIEYLCNHIEVPLIDLMLTMRKIRWRESNSMLAIHFGVSESTVARRFRETLPKVAQCMQLRIITMRKRLLIQRSFQKCVHKPILVCA